MKIFVTVGTTRFDSLTHFIGGDPFFREHDCVLQVGPGGQKLADFECFEYTDQINDYYAYADVVITHAGAGSIYQLLSMRKSIVIVPNIDRLDTHQIDIANFMHTNLHAISVRNLAELSDAVQQAAATVFRPFEHENFFCAENILDFLNS